MEQSGMSVAVVGDDGDVRDAVRRSNGRLVEEEHAEAVVAVGESALREAALDRDGPVLPVDVGSDRYAVTKPAVEEALTRVLDGDARRVEHPLLAVAVDGDRVGTALFDTGLVTSEPARISEYAVEREGWRTAFRADAVVVATPLGSDGYAGAAGGPVLEPGTGLSVVPVSPFATRSNTWVVDDAVTLSVERDDEPVTLLVDDEAWGDVPPHVPVDLVVDGSVELLTPT